MLLPSLPFAFKIIYLKSSKNTLYTVTIKNSIFTKLCLDIEREVIKKQQQQQKEKKAKKNKKILLNCYDIKFSKY